MQCHLLVMVLPGPSKHFGGAESTAKGVLAHTQLTLTSTQFI